MEVLKKFLVIVLSVTICSASFLNSLITPAQAASSGLANTVWPTQTGNNRHTGQSAYEIPANLTVAWTYRDSTTGANFAGEGVIGPSGTIYKTMTPSTVTNSKLLALNSNGILKWSYAAGGDLYSSPVVSQDETIYTQVGEGSGKLLAINADGTLKWQYDTANNVALGTACFIRKPSPTIDSNGVIYTVSATNGKVFALNPDGSLKWQYSLATSVGCATPAIGTDGTIFIDQAGRMTALNPDGTLKWTTAAGTGGGIPISASIDSDGNVYGAGWFTDRAVRKFNGSTGTAMWGISGNLSGGISNGYPRSNVTISTRNGTESVWWQHAQNAGATGRWVNNAKADGTQLQTGNFGIGNESELVFNASGTIGFGKPKEPNLYAFDTANFSQLFKYVLTGSNQDGQDIALGDLTTSLYIGSGNTYYAFKPFTITAPAISYLKTGTTLTIQATSSMLANDPVSLNSNKAQAIMTDGTKVPLSYVSTTGGQSLWQGTYTIPASQTDGNYTYTIEAAAAETQTTTTTHFDTAPTNSNNTGVTTTGSYIVDNNKPYQFTIEAPQYSRDGTVVVTGFVNDDTGIDLVKVQGVGTSFNPASFTGASWHLTYANVPDGVYEFSAYAYDRGGNESYVVAANKTVVDRTAPTLTVTAPNEIAGDKVTITGYVADGYAGLDRLLINDNKSITNPIIKNNGTFSSEFNLVRGANIFTVTASDKAGNSVTKLVTVQQKNQFIPTSSLSKDLDAHGTMPFISADGNKLLLNLDDIVRSLQIGKGKVKKDNAVITALQKVLQGYSYFTAQVTGYFGPKTRQAVRLIQHDKRLKTTGLVDYRLLAILDNYGPSHQLYHQLIQENKAGYSSRELTDAASYQLAKNIKANQYDEEIKFIQKKLYLLGYYNKSINGRLNQSTQQAIAQFRKDQGLGLGLIDQKLRDKLNTL